MARFPTQSGTSTERRIADYAVIDIGGVGPILEEKRIVAITFTALFEEPSDLVTFLNRRVTVRSAASVCEREAGGLSPSLGLWLAYSETMDGPTSSKMRLLDYCGLKYSKPASRKSRVHWCEGKIHRAEGSSHAPDYGRKTVSP